jgi:hypothetical protein
MYWGNNDSYRTFRFLRRIYAWNPIEGYLAEQIFQPSIKDVGRAGLSALLPMAGGKQQELNADGTWDKPERRP